MNKKTLILFIFLFIIILLIGGYFGYQALYNKDNKNNDAGVNNLSDEEKEFNQSGRAKAIQDETDLWYYYEEPDAGFSIKHPHDISFNEQQDDLFGLYIETQKIDLLEGTMGFDKQTALKNTESLKMGEYGQDVDWPLNESKKLRKISDNINAQEFMVLARFEVCNVVFERKLYFFNNDYQIVITLIGPRNEFINSAPEYFTTNQENCGNEKIWNMEKQKLFFENLENNAGPEIIQNWFDVFNRIIGTITLQ